MVRCFEPHRLSLQIVRSNPDSTRFGSAVFESMIETSLMVGIPLAPRSPRLWTMLGCRFFLGFGFGLVSAGHGVQHRVLARLLKLLERLAAHGGIDVLIRGTDRRRELLQDEE